MKKHAANNIAENVLDQFDPYGFYTNVMEVILYLKRDETTLTMYENYFTTKQGRRKMIQLTVRWSFQIKWKNGTTE